MTRATRPPEEGKHATPQWRLISTLAVALAIVAALAAACGGGGSHAAASPPNYTTAPNGTSAPSPSTQSGILFVSCIRAHGVPDFPDSAVTVANGRLYLNVPAYLKSEPQFQTALRLCQKDLPEGGSAAKHQHVSIQQQLSYAHCMRSHGIANFPDPLPGGGFNFTGNTNSTQFAAADNACWAALGSSGPSGS